MKRILLIDDDDDLRPMIRKILERAGYDVVEAPDGKEGLRLFRLDPADLVLTDIYMPEKEGLETIRELRIDFPSVKIIAMSGGSGKTGGFSSLNFAAKFGAIHTISKPFRRQELLDLIQKSLDN
jgi:CheY-like chemotaxis protein